MHSTHLSKIPFAFLLLSLALGGCATRQTASFQAGRPVFDPADFFKKSHSWGILESRSGKPGQTLTTRTTGQQEKDGFHFEQDIAFADGKSQHRSWLLKKVDAHHYTATGTGIIGIARAEAYGNVFHLDFTLDASPGNPLAHLHMSQWMYLQPDGRTMINRDTLTKAGIVVAHITEQFVRD